MKMAVSTCAVKEEEKPYSSFVELVLNQSFSKKLSYTLQPLLVALKPQNHTFYTEVFNVLFLKEYSD